MNKNFLFIAFSAAMLIPTTACGTQLFKKKTVKDTQAKTIENVAPTRNNVPVEDTAALLAGEWIIEQVGETRIDRDEDYPYITFSPKDDAFYGSNGCNVINGVYTVDGPGVITFHNIITTMRYCADVPFDRQINGVLSENGTVNFVYEVKDGEPFLYFEAGGNRVMTLHKPGLDFLNGDWQVTEINGEKFEDSDMRIFFDVEERKVHGNTGCNSFNGEIFVDPQNKRTISLSNMAVTMRMCPNIEQQSKFLVALEQTTGAKVGGKDTVYLTDAKGEHIMTLRAVPVK